MTHYKIQNMEEFDMLYHNIYPYSGGSGDPSYHGSQIKEEFKRAWDCIIEYIEDIPGVVSFLEIGAYKGLWPLMLSFICKKLDKKFNYTTITWLDQDYNNQDLLKIKEYYNQEGLKFKLINLNSQDPTSKSKLKSKYHIVFIDADHRYEGAKKDIELYSSLATKLLIFHDIRPIIPTSNCGVYKAIKDSSIELDKEIIVDGGKMGIGIKFING